MMKPRHYGFTLIELMIVLAIVAILAAFAYPNYREYIIKSRRADAQSGLMNCAAAQERWYTKTTPSQYTDDAGPADDDGPCNRESEQGYYTIAMDSANANSFVISATATSKGGQDDDADCYVMTLDHTGRKASETQCGTPTTGCWKE
jgi:type IV pilus assembly protein PilE